MDNASISDFTKEIVIFLAPVYLWRMQDPEQAPASSPEAATTIFEEPSLSRQWVVRRLQRALTVERWAGPARDGLAHGAETLRGHGTTSAGRAEILESLIRDVGSEPYPSYGIAAPVTRSILTSASAPSK